MKQLRTISQWMTVPYLLVLAFFALRSSQPIPGLYYGKPEVLFQKEGLYIQRGSAYEVAHAARVTAALKRSGKMTLSTSLAPDPIWYSNPASIITLSQHAHRRNFTLEQAGADLVFRLNTTGVKYDGIHRYFRAVDVFKTPRKVHLAITYDGKDVRLYVDGKLHPEVFSAAGDFRGWSRDCALLLGDESAGGRSWRGSLGWFAVFDRVLDGDEVKAQANGDGIGHAVAVYDFRSRKPVPGVQPLRYRNRFVLSDGTLFSSVDCVLNIAAFIPLAGLIYSWLPYRLQFRRFVATILIPTMVGGGISSVIEFIQQYLYFRVPCMLDLIYNTLGSLLGGMLLWSLIQRKRKAV